MNLAQHIQHESSLWRHFGSSYICARSAAIIVLGACVFLACQSLGAIYELFFGSIRFVPSFVPSFVQPTSEFSLLMLHIVCATGAAAAAAAAAWLGLWRLDPKAWC